MRSLALGLALAGLLGCSVPAPAPLNDQQAGQAARANTDLAIHYLRNDALQPASAKIDRALAQDPQLLDAHLVAAEVSTRLSRPDRAERHYRTALAIDGNNGAALNNYAAFLCQQGRPARALDLWEMAAANPLYARQAMVLTNAGDCLAQAERGDQARHYWRRALNHEPTFTPALAAMTAHSLSRGRLDSANAYFSRYTASAEQSPDLLWLGARIAKADQDAERYAYFVQRLRQAFPLSEQAVQLSE